jgi:hypothetical protein
VVLLGVGLIGFAHTEAGRPLLRYIPGMGACPLDVVALTEDDKRRVRAELLAPLAGERAATDRRALAFELGRTTATEVDAWATAHGVKCVSGRKLELRCEGVPATAIDRTSGFDAVKFDFDEHGSLIALEASSVLDSADGAATWIADRDAALRDRLGDPAVRKGEPVADEVGKGPLSQISREYRGSDVRAKVAATNTGRGRFSVREFHQLVSVQS